MSEPIYAAGLYYGDSIVPGGAGYASANALVYAVERGEVARSWWLGPNPVSVQLTKELGAGIWKRADRFGLEDPAGQLAELARYGIEHPSSYADVFWQKFEDIYERKPPTIRATYNGIFDWWAGGPWSEARMLGRLAGSWYRYDLRSAYRWAATLGLPAPKTYAVRRHPGTRAGIFVVEPLETRIDLAPALRGPGPVVMSTEEIEATKFRCRYVRGVTWEYTYKPGYIERVLGELPCPKPCGRAYWGRFIGRDPLICRTPGKTWSLVKNPWQNMVWGWLIVGRVRQAMWEAAQGRAAHVYVDEMVVPFQLPSDWIGDAPGQWREKRRYPNGVEVIRTGHFGPAGEAPDMQTGVRRHGEEAQRGTGHTCAA